MTDSSYFNILIVDDNANNRFVLRTLLARLKNCLIIEAGSGQEALLRTFEHIIHLVLLDVQMPGMDGYETARHFAMIKRTRDIPIIFVTAVFKSEEFIQRGYALGAVDYLTKPIDDNLLLNRIDSYRKLRERELRLADALEQIKLREERFAFALEATQDGIWDWDVTTDAMFISTRFESMLGYPPGTLPKSSAALVDTAHPDDVSVLRQVLTNLKHGEGHTMLEYRVRGYNGNWVWHALRAKLIQKDANGSNRRIVGANADISQRIAAEQALKQAKLEAETANRAKSVFLANMSHELRTPLNAILGFATILEQDSRLSTDQRADISTINKSGHRLLRLINDVLEISRLEVGGKVIDCRLCDLQSILDTVVKALCTRIQATGLTFCYEPASDLPIHIYTDVDKLQQILLHMLTNAMRYTKEGGVSFRVKRHLEASGAEQLLFAVSDTGIGISTEELKHIFEPFFQTEYGSKQGQGAGLGLAISREYATLMGGWITVSSVVGQGSTFCFHMPINVSPDYTAAQTCQAMPILWHKNNLISIDSSIAINNAADCNLAQIPSGLKSALAIAAARLDLDEVAEVISQIKLLDANAAMHLETMTREFRFEQVINLCS